MLDQESLEDGDTSRFLLSPDNLESPDIRSVDPETQARLEALLEAAGKYQNSFYEGSFQNLNLHFN